MKMITMSQQVIIQRVKNIVYKSPFFLVDDEEDVISGPKVCQMYWSFCCGLDYGLSVLVVLLIVLATIIGLCCMCVCCFNQIFVCVILASGCMGPLLDAIRKTVFIRRR